MFKERYLFNLIQTLKWFFLCFLGAFKVAIIAKYSHYPCQLGLLPSYKHEPPKEIFQNYLQYTNNIGLPIMQMQFLWCHSKCLHWKKSQVHWTHCRPISGGHLEIKTEFTYPVSNAISQETPTSYGHFKE